MKNGRNYWQELKSLKNHPSTGWVDSDTAEQAKNKLMTAIRNQGNAGISARQSRTEYIKWMAMNFFVQPVGVGTAVFTLLIGGWITTVSAASNSLPGDPLYGLKLVTEKAQLTIASTDKRAILHTEFAERRLQEVAALDVDSQYLEQTWNAFQEEIKMAGSDLAQLHNQGGEEAVVAASEIDEKIKDLNDEIVSVTEEVNNDVINQDQTQETLKATQEVSNSAVAVLVKEHEESQSDMSARALEKSFKTQYNNLMDRQAFDLGRVEMIETALAKSEIDDAVLSGQSLTKMRSAINDATDKVSKAMDLKAAGGYRMAFDILRQADETLLAIEADLADIENKIISARQQTDIETVETVNAEGKENSEAGEAEAESISNSDSDLNNNKQEAQ